MSAAERDAAAVAVAMERASFDDLGALVTALRHILDGGPPLDAGDQRHAYVLAVMAEAAWQKLDQAMTGAAS